MRRPTAQNAVFSLCLIGLAACWWIEDGSPHRYVIERAGGHLPWLELLGIALVWQVVSGRLEAQVSAFGTRALVAVRAAALTSAALAAGPFLINDYGAWRGFGGTDSNPLRTPLDRLLVYAGVPAVLLYFGVVAVMLGFLATTRSGASWRDTVARLAAVPFLAAVACAALIEGPKSPLVRIPTSPLDAPTLYWLFLAALVLALVMAVLGRGEAAPAPSRHLPLTVDLCVFAVPALAATFADQNGFTLDARAWVALAVTAIGIALLWTLQAPDAERVDGPREPEPAQG